MAQLYFYYSSMNAGKPTHLLQSSYNYQERGLATAIYTAKIDDRFAKGKVASRLGLDADAFYLMTKLIYSKTLRINTKLRNLIVY